MRKRGRSKSKVWGLTLIALGLAISPIPPEGVETLLLLALFPLLGVYSVLLLFLAGGLLIIAGLMALS